MNLVRGSVKAITPDKSIQTPFGPVPCLAIDVVDSMEQKYGDRVYVRDTEANRGIRIGQPVEMSVHATAKVYEGKPYLSMVSEYEHGAK